jgi:hypothetical protein
VVREKLAEAALAVLLVPAVSATGPPTALPPAEHPDGLVNGPQMKKLTVPDGLPPAALPVMATWSESPAARVVVCLAGVETMWAVAWPTVKHSVLEPSLDGS